MGLIRQDTRDTSVSNEERLLKAGDSSSSPVITTMDSPLAPRSLQKPPPSALEDVPPSYDAAMSKAESSQNARTEFDDLDNRAYRPLPPATIGQTPAQIGCPHLERRRRPLRLNVLEAIFFFPIGLIFHSTNPSYACKDCGADLGRVGGSGVSPSVTVGRKQARRVERAQRREQRRWRCGSCNRRRCRPGCSGFGVSC